MKKFVFLFLLLTFLSPLLIKPTYAASTTIALSLSSSLTGGLLSANTYSYEVTSTVSSTESSPSNFQTIVNTGSTSSNTLSWNAINETTYYTIYRSINGGSFYKYAQTTSTSFTDKGWNTSSNTLPQTLFFSASVIYQPATGQAYVYELGGSNGSNNQTTVYYAPINSSTGEIGPWSTASNSLPQARATHAAVIYQNGSTPYIYVLAGRDGSGTNQNTVYYASINTSTGNVNSWNSSSHTLPASLFDPAAVIYQKGSTPYIYVMGGQNGGFSETNNVYYASINTSTGDVGAWNTSSHTIPQSLDSSFAVINESGSTPYIYILGGGNGTSNQKTVYYSAVNTSTGDVGTWSTSANQLPVGLAVGGAGIYTTESTTTIYLIAGKNDSGSFQNKSYYATINNTTNDVNTWSTATNVLPQNLFTPTAVTYTIGNQPYTYVLGGQNSSFAAQDKVYYLEPFQLGSSTTQTPANNVQVDFNNTLTSIDSKALSIDETEYGNPHETPRDTVAQQRFAALHPAVMRIDLKYKTTGDHNSGIVCGAGGCDETISGDSWINTIKSIGAAPMILVPINASDAASIVQHFNKDTNNYVGRYVIGNEPDLNGYTGSTYSTAFNSVAAAMRAVDNTISIGGPTLGVMDPTNTAFLQTFLTNSGSNVDFIDFHQYGEGNAQNEDTLLTDTVNYEQNINVAKSLISSTLGTSKPVSVGEWSLTYNNGDDNQYRNFDTVWSASVYGHILKAGGLSNYYGTKTNLLWGNADSTWGTSLDDYKPSYHGLGMYAGENLFSAFGTNLVMANSSINRVEVYASDNPKNIVMINKDATTSASVNVWLGGIQSATIQVWRKDQTMNQFAQPQNIGSLTVTNGTFSYTLTPYSVTTFVLTTPSANPPTFGGGTSATSKASDPAWVYDIDAGPHFTGTSNFIAGAGDAGNALTFIGNNATHDDIHVLILKNPPLGIIPSPSLQGVTILGDIYQYQALSSFNGYPITSFDNPVTIILPYDPAKIGQRSLNQLRIATFNTVTNRWQLVPHSVVVNKQNQTVATTVSSFGYFVVVYPSGSITTSQTNSVLGTAILKQSSTNIPNIQTKTIPQKSAPIVKKVKTSPKTTTNHCFLFFCW